MSPRQPAPGNLGKDAAFLLKNPEHIDDFLLFRIYNLSRLAVRGVGLMFRRELDISRRDWRILAYVGKHPNMSLTQLAGVAELDPVITSRGVTKLVARRLIAKTRLPSNKRLVVLALTEAGRAVYQQARASAKRYNMDFAACLSDREAASLHALMTRLERQASELTDREISKGGGIEDETE
jgi:DNA-binding MarR family transcriptional regulator